MTERIGILGGTFDPIHHAHLAIAEEARVALGLDRVLLIPAAQQPLKPQGAQAGGRQRLTMIELACRSNPALQPSAIELERAGPSYTVLTLEALHAALTSELYFIVGADALADLPHWYAAARMPLLAHIVGFGRPQAPLPLDQLYAALPGLRGRLTLFDGPQLQLSSSELRRRCAAGLPIRYLTPDPVVDYIAQQGLYRPAPPADQGPPYAE